MKVPCQLQSVIPVYMLSVYIPLKCQDHRLRAGRDLSAVVKNPPASAGDTRDSGSIPGLGRSARGEKGNPLQYPCLENPMDRGAWGARGPKKLDVTEHLNEHTGSQNVRAGRVLKRWTNPISFKGKETET